MRAKLRYLYSPDVDPIESFRPIGAFGVLVTAFVGPDDGPGHESFDFMLCTPEWFIDNRMNNPVVSGRHTVFVEHFDFPALEQFVRAFCESCEGASWPMVGEKVGRLGKWEFEDYRPSDRPENRFGPQNLN